jgi:hypothetical protein
MSSGIIGNPAAAFGVFALAASGNTLYAGGIFYSAGGVSVANIAQWNGSSWAAMGSGMNFSVRALAVSGSNLYAGGSFTNAGGVSVNNIAQWNGSSWAALGSGMNGAVHALAAPGSKLYAGGSFTTAGNKGATNTAEAFLILPAIVSTDGNFGFTTDGSLFGFDVSGGPGETVIVQGSSDMVNWVPLQTNLMSNSVWYFSDSSAGNVTQRYYRAELVP